MQRVSDEGKTMKLDRRTAELVAVGASVSANCLPCLEVNVARAVEDGVDAREIASAIKVGRMVREGAAAKMDRLVSELAGKVPSASTSTGGCGCG